MMRPSFYLMMLLVGIFLAGLMVSVYHYKADRWGVFAEDFESFHERIVINKLYTKTRFLVSTDQSFDCFVFGSSRVAAIDAKRFGEQCYNFTHSGGLVVDHLKALKALMAEGISIKAVHIALDDLSYNEDPRLAPLQHMRREYPDTFPDLVGFLSMFLLMPIDLSDFSLVTGMNPKVPAPRFVIDPDLDTLRIRNRYQKFFDNPQKSDIRIRRLYGMGEGEEYFGAFSIEALRELVFLSKKHDFLIKAFFLPLHYKTYLTRNYTSLSQFKQQVAAILPFHDFSGLNAYTTDNRYWRETSHFSAVVGDQIVGRVMSNEIIDSGMGRLVHKENLAQLEEEQIELDLEFLPLLMRRESVLPINSRYLNQWNKRDAKSNVNIIHQANPHYQHGLNLSVGGRVEIVRGEDPKLRQSNAIMHVSMGDYFVLEYSFVSQFTGQLKLQIAQDDDWYEGKFREIRIRAKEGENAGVLAGYASVDRPKIRLMLGGGDLHMTWQPLSVSKIEPGQKALQRAELDASKNDLQNEP